VVLLSMWVRTSPSQFACPHVALFKQLDVITMNKLEEEVFHDGMNVVVLSIFSWPNTYDIALDL
jgi:hypothetical protein